MNKFLKNLTAGLAASAGTLMTAGAVLASGSWAPQIGGFDDLDTFFSNLLTIMVIVAAAVAVVYLIINGITYITSAGDASKTENAQKGIIAALIGLVVVGVAWLLVRFILDRVLQVEVGDID